jgi:thiamine biosynthesis protein ThiI
VTVRVEIPGRTAYVIGPARPGPGGLPPGTTGTLLAFLSGGIDSPVAAWKMMRRGAYVVAAHFWNRTLQGNAVLEKLEDLCRVLALAQGEVPLLVVPFEPMQRAIVAQVKPALRMLVYRRAMLRIGARQRRRARGLRHGDSLGQVASGWLSSSARSAPRRPPCLPASVRRDKIEGRIARRIGTFDISTAPKGLLPFMLSEHPATKSLSHQRPPGGHP